MYHHNLVYSEFITKIYLHLNSTVDLLRFFCCVYSFLLHINFFGLGKAKQNKRTVVENYLSFAFLIGCLIEVRIM